jgi:hypothetical protein
MLKWAQRRDRLFITLDVQDVAGEVVSLSAEELVFTGEGGGSRQYALDLRFYKPVDPHHQVRASRRVALCFDSRCRES